MNNNAGDAQSFIGNEITNGAFPFGNYMLTGQNHFEAGNNKNGKILPAGTGNLQEKSLYLETVPAFYENNKTWPVIGFPNALNTNQIEPQHIFEEKQFTSCAIPNEPGEIDVDLLSPKADTAIAMQYTTVNSNNNIASQNIQLYPNPAQDFLHLKIPADVKITKAVIYSAATGKEISLNLNTGKIEIMHLVSGVYFIQIQLNNGLITNLRFVKL
jgi:hypothetical protein